MRPQNGRIFAKGSQLCQHFVDFSVQEDGEKGAEGLCNHHSRPDHGELTGEAHGPCDGDHENQLASQIDHQGIAALAQCLKGRGEDQRCGAQREAQAADAQGGDPDGEHGIGGAEQLQELCGDDFECNKQNRHQHQRSF